MAEKHKITFVYNRLSIEEIQEKVGYEGNPENLRQRILNGTISEEWGDRIADMIPIAKKTPLTTKEQTKRITDLIGSIGYRKIAERIGVNSKNFNMEMYYYCSIKNKNMSVHRYKYLKEKIKAYLKE